MPENCAKFRIDSLKQQVKQLNAERTAAVHALVMYRDEALVAEGNTGKFYRYVNNKMTNKMVIGLIKDTDGTFVDDEIDDTKKLNYLMISFDSAFIKDNKKCSHYHQ